MVALAAVLGSGEDVDFCAADFLPVFFLKRTLVGVDVVRFSWTQGLEIGPQQVIHKGLQDIQGIFGGHDFLKQQIVRR